MLILARSHWSNWSLRFRTDSCGFNTLTCPWAHRNKWLLEARIWVLAQSCMFYRPGLRNLPGIRKNKSSRLLKPLPVEKASETFSVFPWLWYWSAGTRLTICCSPQHRVCVCVYIFCSTSSWSMTKTPVVRSWKVKSKFHPNHFFLLLLFLRFPDDDDDGKATTQPLLKKGRRSIFFGLP